VDKKLTKNINELLSQLDHAKLGHVKALIGLDGFVDEILHVVDTRKDTETYTRIKTLRDYGERIIRAEGLSTSVELVSLQKKLGGNGPIYANALIAYGMDVTYIGALGYPDIHPVFKPMVEKAELISVTNPGTTDALEFEDGKLIVSKIESFKEISWERIKERIGLEALISMFDACPLLGLENWTMIPYMSDIWRHLLDEVVPKLQGPAGKSFILFDLADPEKRTCEDINEALDLICEFSSHYRVILGLNKKELYEIAKALKVDCGGENSLRNIVTNVAKKLDIYCLLVHPVDSAVALSEGTYFDTQGPYASNPLITTGAGDHFNAGFCAGLMLGLSIQLSMVLGTSTSGYYVRNAKSPSISDTIEFLKKWRDGSLA
jgi:hypothetical protein